MVWFAVFGSESKEFANVTRSIPAALILFRKRKIPANA
jgi:hypothetical protein